MTREESTELQVIELRGKIVSAQIEAMRVELAKLEAERQTLRDRYAKLQKSR